ncbi:autotransporter outer membrane beta-barrel domain-containing protein [Nocardia tengchongensis]|uniref:hypothetical protein n=1 Tax=Nocardia tengchongensis TaxID=2055889 RepID=UPI003653AD80
MALPPQFFAGVGEAMKDLLLANVCSAVADVDINIFGIDIHPFAFLQTWGTNLRNDANTAIQNSVTIASGINGGNSDPTKVANTVGGIQTNIAANSAAISALQTQQTQQQTGGASVTVTWSDTVIGNIGPGWTLGGESTAPWAQGNGVAGIQPDNHYGSGRRHAINTTVMLTDDHQVTMVAGTSGSDQAMTSLLVRCAADLSSFVYLNVFHNHAYLGYGSWNGSTYVFHDWADVALGGLAVGTTLTLRAEGQNYIATISGSTLLSHTDSTIPTQATVGSSNRRVGMISGQYVDLFGSAYTGWDIKSFAAADVSSPPVVGTGWSIYQSTSSQNLPGSGWTTVGSSAFDTVRQKANVTVTTLGTGVITIQKTGWYSVAFAATVITGQVTAAAGLYYQPAGAGSASIVRQGARVDGGGGGDNTANYTVATSNVLYLSAGDQIFPAVYTGIGSGKTTGTGSAGASYTTYFEGALLNSA